MRKNEKMVLDEIRIDSFVTTVDISEGGALKGGFDLPKTITTITRGISNDDWCNTNGLLCTN